MNIRLEKVGKKFKRKWIFKDVDVSFETGGSYAILGDNGSGKSTLLKLICGYILPTQGKRYINEEEQGQLNKDHEMFSFVAPYIDLYRSMTLSESVDFHFGFKNRNHLNIEEMLNSLSLPMHRELKDFSSGMLQRVKLALAFCTDSPFLLLDEPLMNLDEKGGLWYTERVAEAMKTRTVIIASNERDSEMGLCNVQLRISDKTVKKN